MDRTATNRSSKRKVPDVNDNFDPFPAPAPPALRSATTSSRRMTIAGALPGLPLATPAQWAVPAPAAPAAGRRHAEEAQALDHADSLYNNYIATLALKLKTERATARTRRDVEGQLSVLLNETVSMKEAIAEVTRRRDVGCVLGSATRMTQQLPAMLAESVLKHQDSLETLAECVCNHANSLASIDVKPMVEASNFRKVEESLNELGENFNVPKQTIENSVNTADCLHDIGELMILAEEENKCLNQIKDTNYSTLVQNLSSSVKL